LSNCTRISNSVPMFMDRSDEVLKERIKELESTYYREVLETYFSDLAHSQKRSDYLENKIKSVTKALEQMYVYKSQKEETFSLFKNFQRFEKILFQSPEYRGHYAHQFDVYLLGYYMLNKLLEGRSDNLQDYISQVFKGRSNEPNFTWMLTATFHDMGYPIEQIDNWFKEFLSLFLKVETPIQFGLDQILTPIFYEYIGYLSETHHGRGIALTIADGKLSQRDWRFHNILHNALRQKKHGVISSLLLIHSLLTQEDIGQHQEWFYGTFPNSVLPACHAIAVHDLDLKDYKISLKQFPYAFLLVLCDTLQDWKRSTLPKDYSELIDINVSPKEPKIEVKLQINDTDEKIKELKNLKDRLDTEELIEITIRDSNDQQICTL
jgi:hypothetical protein